MNKKLSFILRIFITFSLLFVLIKIVPYKNLIDVCRSSQKEYLFLGFGILCLAAAVVFWRWKYILDSLGFKISLSEVSMSFLTGMFFNLFFPSFVAGDVFRGISISSRYGQAKKAASSVVMDRFCGCVALIVVAFCSFLAGRNILVQPQVFVSLMILAVGAVFVFLVIFSRRFFSFITAVFKKKPTLRQKLIDFHTQIYFFRKNPQFFINAMFLSLVAQGLNSFGFFVMAKAFGVDVSIMYFFILIPIIMAVAMLPITIAGIGTREAAAVYFLSLAGIEKSVGLSISFLNLAFLIFLGVIGGILYVSIYHRWLQPHT